MSEPVLTILVPTYNRSVFLRSMILDLVKAVHALPSGSVEIFVSDNNSNDDTESIIAEISGKYSFLKYHKHEKHYHSGEENIFYAIHLCSGQYVWTVSDDDKLVDGAVEYIYNVCKKDLYDFMLINVSHYSTNGNLRVFSYIPHESAKPLLSRPSYNLLDIIEAFGFLGLITSISSAVFRRDPVKNSNIEEYLALSPIYSHAAIYIDAFKHRPSIYIDKPLVMVFDDEGLALEKIAFVSARTKTKRFYSWTVGACKLIERLGICVERVQEAGPHGRAYLADLIISMVCDQLDYWLTTQQPSEALTAEDFSVIARAFATASPRHLFLLQRLEKAIFLARPYAMPTESSSSSFFKGMSTLSDQASAKFKDVLFETIRSISSEVKGALVANPAPVNETLNYKGYKIQIINDILVAYSRGHEPTVPYNNIYEHFPYRLICQSVENAMKRIDDISALVENV